MAGIPVVLPRLYRAQSEINKRFKLTKKHGKYKNRIRATTVISVLNRMNRMRERGIKWHSALVQAAAEQKGVGPQRAAMIRKIISLYGWWTRRALEKQGRRPDWYGGKLKIGDDVVIKVRVNEETGQYGFL